jgi:hypothetical protein
MARRSKSRIALRMLLHVPRSDPRRNALRARKIYGINFS